MEKNILLPFFNGKSADGEIWKISTFNLLPGQLTISKYANALKHREVLMVYAPVSIEQFMPQTFVVFFFEVFRPPFLSAKFRC